MYSMTNSFINKRDKFDKMEKLLDEFFQNEYEFNQPGAAVLIVCKNQIVYQRCFGLANLQTGDQLTPQTNFRLASLTKQFTAYGIILLEQQGQLSRTDPIGKYFPLEFRERCPFVSTHVTIQHLLDHSSGLIDYEDHTLHDHHQWSDFDVLEILSDQTLFPPGSEYRYSNTGYILLGLILENVSSTRLDQFFSQYIFQPFNMTESVLVHSEETRIPNRALGYIKNIQGNTYDLCDQSSTSATRGDGGIYMSLKDYFQWYRHYQLITPISPYPIDQSTSSQSFYHLGWFLSGQLRAHTGNSCGFTHQVFRMDDEGDEKLLLYLSNLGNNNEQIRRFNRFLQEEIPQLNPKHPNLLWEMERLTR